MPTTLETLKSKQRQAKPQKYGKKTKFVSPQIVNSPPVGMVLVVKKLPSAKTTRSDRDLRKSEEGIAYNEFVADGIMEAAGIGMLHAEQRCQSMLATISAKLDHQFEFAAKTVCRFQMIPIPPTLRQSAIEQLIVFVKRALVVDSQLSRVAIGAAIRKSMLNSLAGELSFIVPMIEESESGNHEIAVKLEAMKMLTHWGNHDADFASSVPCDIKSLAVRTAKQYAKAEEIEKRFVNALALNACLAVFYMRLPESADIYQQLIGDCPEWFAETMETRIQRLAKEINQGNCDQRLNETIQFASELGFDIEAS